MIDRKTDEQITIMREGGRKLGDILQELLAMSAPGVRLLDIEACAQKRIIQAGGTPSFHTVKGYRWATCLCVNETVVHGIPTGYELKDGDMLTIDIGLLYGGLHTDSAWTTIVGRDRSSEKTAKESFLRAGTDALWKAVSLARVGNRIGHISQCIQRIIEGAGYSIVKTLVGHGVGRELHEEPQVPNHLRGSIESTYQLVGGETVAIEPIYAMGQGDITYGNDDGWTLVSRDRSLTAVFEHSVAVTPDGPIVLTESAK